MTPQAIFILHAASFATGFWWVCHQKKIDGLTILTSLFGGLVVGIAAVLGLKFYAHDSMINHLPLLPFAALIGATCALWGQAREALSQPAGRDDVYALTLSFVYFLTPWADSLVKIGTVLGGPALLVLLICWSPKALGPRLRGTLMFWSIAISIVMGVHSLWSSPESILPRENVAGEVAAAVTWIKTSLQASGFVFLALNILPLFSWISGSSAAPDQGDRAHEDGISAKMLLIFTLLHGVPLLVNWKLHLFSYAAMLDFSLAWTPIFAAAVAKSFCESAKDTGFHPAPGTINQAS